jgi:hypothetical protein
METVKHHLFVINIAGQYLHVLDTLLQQPFQLLLPQPGLFLLLPQLIALPF